MVTTTTTPPAAPWNPKDGIKNYALPTAVPATVADAPVAQGVTAEAASATSANRTLDPNELVSTQLGKVMAADSPVLQQAEGRAKVAANSRGLLNSSMAIQAGQGAVLDRAMPIAQADAAANTRVADTNNANTQQTNVFNAGNVQDVNKFNASNQQQNNQFNADKQNNNNIVNATEQNKILSQFLDQGSKLQLADIEASYKTILQSEASASTLYQQSVRNISDILQNPDLTPEAKTAAVTNQNALLKTGLNIIGKIGGLNLEELLVFPTA